MPPALQVLLGRILGGVAAGIVAWLTSKGFDVTKEDIPTLVSAMITTGSLTYGVIHTWYNAKYNKKDVSSPKLLPLAQADAHYEEAKVANAPK